MAADKEALTSREENLDLYVPDQLGSSRDSHCAGDISVRRRGLDEDATELAGEGNEVAAGMRVRAVGSGGDCVDRAAVRHLLVVRALR